VEEPGPTGVLVAGAAGIDLLDDGPAAGVELAMLETPVDFGVAELAVAVTGQMVTRSVV